MADKYQGLISGRETMVEGQVTSAGAAQAGKIVALDAGGKLDLTLLPSGVGPLVILVVASEALAAGKYVNIWDNLGTANVRLADSTNDRPAHGFVKDAFASLATATVYLRTGVNDDLSGLTPGGRVYLDAAGGVQQTPPSIAGGDVIHQFLGVAQSATVQVVDIEDEIVL